jgi:heme-degrading monooxygenase HmoA
MRIKHIAFSGVGREAWVGSQGIWLERSIASGGLRAAYAAERDGDARAVFAWANEDALRVFMEESHDRALEAAGSIGRYAVLHLEPLTLLAPAGDERVLPAPPRDAGYMGETIAWVKDDGEEVWQQSQRTWNEALVEADGFAGGFVARGRRTFVVTSFWRDAAAHQRYERDIVPGLRERTRGDERTARLLRFHGPLVPTLWTEG